MNADDRLSLDPFGPVEGGDAIVEGSHVTDVCAQPAIPGSLDDLTQLGAVGDDDEIVQSPHMSASTSRGPR